MAEEVEQLEREKRNVRIKTSIQGAKENMKDDIKKVAGQE